MSEAAPIYFPSPWQQKFHSLPHDEALGAGSVGPGKTECLIMEPLAQIICEDERARNPKHPHYIGKGNSVGWALYLRRTMPQLRQTIIRAKAKYLRMDPSCKWNAQDSTLEFYSGYRYQFGHVKDADSWLDYYSNEYCAAGGTKVLMADKSYREIQEIVVGDLVHTLAGPRRVTATHQTGMKPCVRATTVYRGAIVGTQLHPSTHPVLLAPSDESQSGALPRKPRTGQRARPHGLCWQDYESVLFGRSESPVKRVSAIGVQICSGEFGGLPEELMRLPPLCVQVALHEPEFHLGRRGGKPTECREPSACWPLSARIRRELGLPGLESRADPPPSVGEPPRIPCCNEAPVSCDDAYGPPGFGTATDSPGSYSLCYDLRDGRLRLEAAGGPGSVQPPDDVALRAPICWRGHAGDDTPIDTPARESRYPHFYTGEGKERLEALHRGIAILEWAGWFETFDLTVEDANHYITESGLVNAQTIVMFDELITFTEEQYDQIRSRVRTSDPILMKMLKTRAMSNPVITAEMMDGASLNNDPLWVRKRFVEPGWNEEKGMYGEVTLTQDITLDSGEKVQRKRIYLPATLRDNPNKEFVRTTEMNLRTMKPHIQRVLLKGDWFAAAGAYYADEWDERLHVCKPFKIPDSWLRFRGMDWGFKAPGCIHWWALDEDGNMFCERELYFKGLTAAKVAARVKDAEIDLGLWDKSSDRSKITGPADTQLWEKRGSTAMSMAEEFLVAGVPWVKADKSSRARNAQLLSKRLSDHQNKTTQPGIVFFRTCKKAIQTIPVVIADPKMPDQPLDGGDDHALDEILYSCAFASRGRVGIPAKRQEMKYEDEVEPSRGQLGYGDMV